MQEKLLESKESGSIVSLGQKTPAKDASLTKIILLVNLGMIVYTTL